MKRCPQCKKDYLDDSLGVFGSTHEFDVTRDGQKFVIGTLIGEPTAPPPTVILNWTALVRK